MEEPKPGTLYTQDIAAVFRTVQEKRLVQRVIDADGGKMRMVEYTRPPSPHRHYVPLAEWYEWAATARIG